ncbi:hypothetical protein EYF80_050460 [Liparis tanakae]|uniref:Uncharacterized protein n=1 Tax=Liparis tanakae TaxID=230148 RepID=A0A4Z2FG38_9TELE|nr:hypothetical protein EYF80_050460 [Liparis tanakae]
MPLRFRRSTTGESCLQRLRSGSSVRPPADSPLDMVRSLGWGGEGTRADYRTRLPSPADLSLNTHVNVGRSYGLRPVAFLDLRHRIPPTTSLTEETRVLDQLPGNRPQTPGHETLHHACLVSNTGSISTDVLLTLPLITPSASSERLIVSADSVRTKARQHDINNC